MKIGLYGGAFDPFHNAHLQIANFVKDELGLDKVIFIPASVSHPHKNIGTPPEIRFKMVNSSISDIKQFECSRIEIEREGTSFSYDTICEIKKNIGVMSSQVYWIIGADNLSEFHKWYKPHQILKECNVVVFPRDISNEQINKNQFYKDVIYLKNAPLIEISSSKIRSLVKQGASIDKIVPQSVNRIIIEENLYR